MTNSRRFTLKSIVAVSAATAVLGVGAVPAAYSAPKSKPGTTTETTTDTITDTTSGTDTTVSGGTANDPKTSGGGRKIG